LTVTRRDAFFADRPVKLNRTMSDGEKLSKKVRLAIYSPVPSLLNQ